jgi:antirestriction protein ArdC
VPNLYEQITNRILEQLDRGVVPWKSPYFSKTGFPKNFSTQKEYRGINVLLLASQRFTSPFFLTLLQAKELGGNVRKGEKGHLVVKYGTYSKEEDAAASSDDSAKSRGYLKAYTVFHASQIDGISFPEPEAFPELTLTEKTDRARAIIEGMPNRPAMHEGSAVPCYRPGTDSVHMPEKDYFVSEEAFFGTLFHELAHSTGHASRLARRSLMNSAGINSTSDTARKTYAEEELVAEMAASFLNAEAGIIEEEIENSAAYIKGWSEAFRSKEAKSWVVRAASEGQKAADFILGRS